MKRRTLVQSHSDRHPVAPEPADGRQPLTSMQPSRWAGPVPRDGNLDPPHTPSTLTTASAHSAQNPR